MGEPQSSSSWGLRRANSLSRLADTTSANPPSPKEDDDTPPMSEAELLDKLHIMCSILLSPQQDDIIANHLALVHATGRRSQVLDVGTGTGAWAINLATHHPYADVVGVDIDWHTFQAAKLPHGNADFFTVDVTKPLPWPENTFDLIHAKSILMDIPRYPQLIDQLSRILRPGGMLVLVESELRYQCIDGPPAEALTVFTEAFKRALAARETDIDLPPNLDKPIENCGRFSSQFYFQEIGCSVGSYVQGCSQTHRRVGEIQKSVLKASLDRLICRRIEPGPERTLLESLVKECTRELLSPTARYFQRLFAVYAYKRTNAT